EDVMMTDFARLLADARKRAGVTQKELAEQVGVDHSYISKIERGIYDPPARDKVLAIANILGITQSGERAYFVFSAGYAPLSEDLAQLQQETSPAEKVTMPLAGGSFHFPSPERLEEENIVGRIRQLLQSSELSREERTEYINILRSFVSWLEFRIGKDRDQQKDK